MAIRLHVFVVVFALGELDLETVERLTDAAQAYAIENKTGLRSGLQTGTATIPVFLCPKTNEATEGWFASEPKQPVYAAMRFPVLANLDTGSATFYSGRWSRGQIFAAYIRGIATDVVTPSLARVTPAQTS
jgi:hypothetical protein